MSNESLKFHHGHFFDDSVIEAEADVVAVAVEAAAEEVDDDGCCCCVGCVRR